MDETIPEPPAELGVVPSGDVPDEAPATDAPGAKIYVCPACGTRYDEPTTCSVNGHAPTATVEYDRATFEAAVAGDADAIASVNETATAAAGNTAGVVAAEATPAAPALPDPQPATPVGPTDTAVDPAAPAAPAAPATPAAPPAAPAAPELGGVAHALGQLEAAISAARNSLGL